MRENDFLDWIARHTPPHPAVQLGIGDDMAAVHLTPPSSPSSPSSTTPTAPGAALPLVDLHNLALLKIDQALDRVHFDLREHPPRACGRKAVNRCLSDCAAMACSPAAILLSVALPPTADANFSQELFLGCQEAAAAFDCPVVGGDTAIWDQRLALTVAALGRTDRPPVTRAGAQPGDLLCVSGALGGAILGRHMTFTPRIHLALELTRRAQINAMMDISDGLAVDLLRLCARSGVGAVVDLAQLPVHPDARRLAAQDGRPPELHALGDGEDYELLFTLPAVAWTSLAAADLGIPLTRIGTILPDRRLELRLCDGTPAPWPAGGWEYTT